MLLKGELPVVLSMSHCSASISRAWALLEAVGRAPTTATVLACSSQKSSLQQTFLQMQPQLQLHQVGQSPRHSYPVLVACAQTHSCAAECAPDAVHAAAPWLTG